VNGLTQHSDLSWKWTSMRRRVLVTALALLAGVAVAPGAVAARPTILPLAGDNSITFAGPSGQRVLITKRVTFSNLAEGNPDLQITGGGTLAVFALVRDGDLSGLRAPSTESLVAVRMPASSGGGLLLHAPKVPATEKEATVCLLPDVPLTCGDTFKDPHLATLAPGYYRVVGIGQKGTTTVRLTLHGLEGTRDLAPATSVVGAVLPYTRPVPATPTSVTASGGAFSTLGGRGLLFHAMTVDQGPWVGAQSTYECRYEGAQLALEPVAFLPSCPGADQIAPPVWTGFDITSGRQTHVSLDTAAAGLHGRGFTHTQTGPVTFVDGWGVALTFPR
jgi:hypothetical protein